MNNSDGLRKLILACVDDARTLQYERRFVDAGRAKTLKRMAFERGRFVVDLELLEAHVPPRPTGSWVEALRETARSLWIAAAGPNQGDAIASCRESRARIQALYEEAMQHSLPEDVRCVLEEQWRLLRDETDELNHLQF